MCIYVHVDTQKLFTSAKKIIKTSVNGLYLSYIQWIWDNITKYNYFLSKFSSFFQEKAMAPHSSTLAWTIPWTEEPGGLQSMALLRVGHD